MHHEVTAKVVKLEAQPTVSEDAFVATERALDITSTNWSIFERLQMLYYLASMLCRNCTLTNLAVQYLAIG